MTEFFLTVVNMSISASWLALAVLLLRLVFKKAPKWITVLLWGIVAVRLVCPFSIESALSLIPSTQTIIPEGAINTPEINSGVPIIDNALNPIIGETIMTLQPEKSLNLFQLILPYMAGLWLVGIVALLIYTAASYVRLKKKIGTAVLYNDNIFQSECVVSPFVLGIIKPKIYLPFNMGEQDMALVIAHERAHIRRKDHLWKPLGFLLLTLHWFNPLMWLGYILLCRDIELACDEKVVKELKTDQRADYSQALLTCSVNRRMITACPIAFGEVGVKDRVKSVLSYKKPAFWVIVVAVVASVALAVGFLTNPKTVDADMTAFIEEQIIYHHADGYFKEDFYCADFKVLGTKKDKNNITVYMWAMCQAYSEKKGEFVLQSGSQVPTAITVNKENGQFTLVEYWEASDGSYYTESIKQKFPWYLQWQAIYFQPDQGEICDNKAQEYFRSGKKAAEVIEESEYYKITEKSFKYTYFKYTYFIYDKNGNILQSDTIERQPFATQLTDNIVELHAQMGTGAFTNWSIFFDVETGKKSKTFHSVLATEKDYVVYAAYNSKDEHSIVIQNVFDKSKYYKIVSFPDASNVAADFAWVESFKNGKCKIVYLAGEDYEEKRITVNIP